MLTGAGLLTGKSQGRMRVGMLSRGHDRNAVAAGDVADTALKFSTWEGGIMSLWIKHFCAETHIDEE